jgi:hypothetical protein
MVRRLLWQLMMRKCKNNYFLLINSLIYACKISGNIKFKTYKRLIYIRRYLIQNRLIALGVITVCYRMENCNIDFLKKSRRTLLLKVVS